MLLKENLKDVQHLGIPVLNIDKAVKWYEDVLSFKIINEAIIPRLEGNIKIVFLRLNDIILELYQLVGEEYEELKTRTHGKIDHIAIDVLSVKEALEHLKQKGVQVNIENTKEKICINDLWYKDVNYINIFSQNGEKIELKERLDLEKQWSKDIIGGWSHLGIPVTNIQKSVEFYNLFGFHEVSKEKVKENNEYTIISMMERDGLILELYQLSEKDLEKIKQRRHGYIDHIAFNVKDAQRAYLELKEKGLKLIEDNPIAVPCWDKGSLYFMIEGPDGEKLEFNEKIY